MTMDGGQISIPGRAGWPLADVGRLLLVVLLPAVHLAMFSYDLGHPARFINADRAWERLDEMQRFAQLWHDGGNLSAFIGSHGVVGDWLPQALLYLAGGQYLVIVVQVLLALAAIFWVRAMGLRLGLTPAVAQGAALLYGLLPHSLVLPHQLTSEAIFIPLLVGSFALLLSRADARGWAWAGILCGTATLVRPVILLWPVLWALLAPVPRRLRTVYLGTALAPVLVWAMLVHNVTGEFSLGGSSHDLGHNLYERARHIAATFDLPQPPVTGVHGFHILSLGEYATFAADHPGPVLAHSAGDVLAMTAKSGVERILLDYLDLAPRMRQKVQSVDDGWRSHVERQGMGPALLAIFQRNPAMTLATAGGALLFCGLMLFAVRGAYAWLHLGNISGADGNDDTRALQRWWLLLVLFPIYVLLTAQAVDVAQSRHRAPAEFALVLLAAAGWVAHSAAGKRIRSMVIESRVATATSPSPVLAVFDLDGTLTRGDTLLPFLLFVTGPAHFVLRLLRTLPVMVGLALKLLPRDRAKESVLRIFLAGMSALDLERRGRVFAARRMPRMMRPQALAQLAWHQAQGHCCVLLSASPAVYAEPWARGAGFDHVLATELQRDRDGRITGRLAGCNCRGTEKVRRLEARFGNLAGFVIHGYGDSRADRPFLDRCTIANFRPFHEVPSTGAKRNRAADLVRLMRPHQWIKNLFVFTGLIFGHAWHSAPLVAAAVLAAAAFSLTASAVYIVNDWLDRERDRFHPTKRERPLAAGRVTPAAAFSLSALLLAAGIALALAASPGVAGLVAAYVTMNLAYSLALKNVVILDVFVIAAGFMLRILAGTFGIGIPPSQWLLFCGFLLTLFLGFTKRRAELLALPPSSLGHRRSLAEYGGPSLDQLIGICAGGVIMSYSLYTMSPDTIRIQGTGGLIYTVPFVVFGVFRYLHLLHRRQGGTDTARDLARDRHLQACVAGWAATTLLLIA